jgi:hypothetical protein
MRGSRIRHFAISSAVALMPLAGKPTTNCATAL